MKEEQTVFIVHLANIEPMSNIVENWIAAYYYLKGLPVYWEWTSTLTSYSFKAHVKSLVTRINILKDHTSTKLSTVVNKRNPYLSPVCLLSCPFSCIQHPFGSPTPHQLFRRSKILPSVLRPAALRWTLSITWTRKLICFLSKITFP